MMALTTIGVGRLGRLHGSNHEMWDSSDVSVMFIKLRCSVKEAHQLKLDSIGLDFRRVKANVFGDEGRRPVEKTTLLSVPYDQH